MGKRTKRGIGNMSIDGGEYGLLMMASSQHFAFPGEAPFGGARDGFLPSLSPQPSGHVLIAGGRESMDISLDALFATIALASKGGRPDHPSPGGGGSGRGPGDFGTLSDGDPNGDDDGDGIPNSEDPDSVVVVIGRKPLEYDPNPGDDTGGGGGSTGGGGGTIGRDPAYDLNHTEDCGTPQGAAEQVSKKIQTSDDAKADGSVAEVNWKNSEFGAVIVRQPDGRFGVHDETVHTDGLPNQVGLPTPSDVTTIAGLVHNHLGSSKDYNLSLIASYPSDDDWIRLAEIFTSRNLAVPPDVAIYIVDPFGNLREYKYSDREKYDAMDDSDRRNPDNLPEPIKGVACGSA